MSGREAWLRAPAAGLLLGVLWGLTARGWMRLISVEPEFSWTGTLMIVGLSGVAGLSLGVVHAARAVGGRSWWRLAALPSVMLFGGPGMFFLPSYVLGGWALATRRHMLLRVAAVALPAAVPVLAWLDVDPVDRAALPVCVFIGGFVLLSAGLAVAGSVVTRAWPTGSRRREVTHALVA